MYTVTKRMEVSAAHHLVLDYESKCEHLHGHNWIIYVTCQAEALDRNGMVVDFKKISDGRKYRQMDLRHRAPLCQSNGPGK